jgi:flagellar biogenesis protein FliO
MAFAMPIAAQGKAPRALLVRAVPALLLCAGALLLAQPWRSAPANPFANPSAVASPAAVTAVLPAAAALEPAPVIGALLVVGGLLFFLPALLARFSRAGRGRGAIAVVEARSLGGRKTLLLVEVEGRRLLVGASEHGFSTLADLSTRPHAFQGELERELRPVAADHSERASA